MGSGFERDFRRILSGNRNKISTFICLALEFSFKLDLAAYLEYELASLRCPILLISRCPLPIFKNYLSTEFHLLTEPSEALDPEKRPKKCFSLKLFSL
jgi:hypothetical protein